MVQALIDNYIEFHFARTFTTWTGRPPNLRCDQKIVIYGSMPSFYSVSKLPQHFQIPDVASHTLSGPCRVSLAAVSSSANDGTRHSTVGSLQPPACICQTCRREILREIKKKFIVKYSKSCEWTRNSRAIMERVRSLQREEKLNELNFCEAEAQKNSILMASNGATVCAIQKAAFHHLCSMAPLAQTLI